MNQRLIKSFYVTSLLIASSLSAAEEPQWGFCYIIPGAEGGRALVSNIYECDSKYACPNRIEFSEFVFARYEKHAGYQTTKCYDDSNKKNIRGMQNKEMRKLRENGWKVNEIPYTP